MKTVTLALKENPYKIFVGAGILNRVGSQCKKAKLGQDAVIITNPIVDKLYGQQVRASLKKEGFRSKCFIVPDGEKSKSAKEAFKLFEAIASYDVLKKPFIIALGGGVIGDLAGFIAATYKRGIPFIQIPTTFLAQIDSAIGGKVAIDLPVGKNLVGAFYQPKFVLSDISVLKTLPKRQILNGFAEAVKYGVIRDKDLYDYIDKHTQALLVCDDVKMAHVVLNCSRIKADVVASDEKETKGIRVILNFGHTIGHAIETAARFNAYHHGEAVALGMRVAFEIALQLKMVTEKITSEFNDLLDRIGLPKKITKVSLSDIKHFMNHDKKFISGKNRFVLPRKLGQVKVIEGVPVAVITAAVKKYM